MSVSAPKRKRCENWSENEKTTLFALLEERVGIIECKQTDSNTNKRKQSAWRELEERFNMIFDTNRNITQLKEQWKRMKTAAKKNIAQYKKCQSATGGGTNNSVITDMDWRIKSLLPHDFIKDTNNFDNDHESNNDETQSQDPVIVVEFQHQAQVHREESINNNDSLCPNELGYESHINENSYSILRNLNMSEHDDILQDVPTEIICHDNVTQASVNTTSAECGTAKSAMTPRQQAPINTQAYTRSTESRNVDTLPRTSRHEHTQALITQAPRHDLNITQSSSRSRTRTSTRASRSRNLGSESEYHRLLIDRKSEEYDLKFKQMKEIHELEVKKRNIEIENLLLAKEKIKLQIEITKNQIEL